MGNFDCAVLCAELASVSRASANRLGKIQIRGLAAMPLLTWTEDMKVNVEVLDEDHKRLFVMINELHDAIAAGHGKKMLMEILYRLMEYTRNHLAREEELLASAGYPGLAVHRHEHERMQQRVQNLRERFEKGSTKMVSLELKSFLQNWWILHIQGTDKKYGPFLNSKGIN
jgi:hemerythrin